MKLLAGVAALCVSLAFTACGGDDDSSATSEAPGSGEPQTTPAKAAKDLAGCLEKAGDKPTVLPPPPEGVPGSEFGSTGTVKVAVGQGDQVVAVFFENREQAVKLTKGGLEGALAPTAEAEVIGSVLLTATKGKLEEQDTFRSCLKR